MSVAKVAVYLMLGPALGVGIGLVSYYGLILIGNDVPEQARAYLVVLWGAFGSVVGLVELFKIVRFHIYFKRSQSRGGRGMLVSFCAACFSIVDYLWAVRKPYMNMEIKELKRRNRWISVIATILMFSGLLLPLLFTDAIPDEVLVWYCVFVLSSMVTLPAAFVLSITIPFGVQRFYEFASYQEVSDGIGWRGLYTLYCLEIILWGVAAIKVVPWLIDYYR